MPGFRQIVPAAALLLCALSSSSQVPAPTAKPTTASPVQTAAPKPQPTVPAEAHPLDKADLETFFDGILPLQMERSDIAGASVLVMKDGNLLLQKGYGYADVKSKKAVDPNSTIFRLASISKLFTWISVMQLEEQGKLNLDTDINRYLDFEIKPAFNRPITLRNLMTHTGGFEEAINNIILTDPAKAISLRDDLIQNQPKRIFPPGEVPAYSNYGVGLASYIVQRISGEPFEQYVQEHIFTPLAMTHSTFYQPPPKALSKLPSEGYRGDTTKPTVGFEIFSPVGAGGISSTAADMGRFGQALLDGGTLDGKRILLPETMARMWIPQFQANDHLPPICMGFYQTWRNDLRWIGHEGDLIAFHSLFFVEPKQKLVLFVAYNSAGGGSRPRPEIIDFFSDRYFPSAQQPNFLKAPGSELKAIEGAYEATRRAESTKLRVFNFFGQRTASLDKDGVLHVEGLRDLRGHPIQWKPIGKDLWQEQDGQDKLFAIRDEGNKVVRIAFDFAGVQMQRVPWYENNHAVLPAIAISTLILCAVVVAVFSRLGKRIFLRRRPRPAPVPGTIWLTWGPQAAAFTWLLFFGTVAGFFIQGGDDLLPPTSEWFPWFVRMNYAVGFAILLSLVAVASAIRAWARPDLRWITKVKFSVTALACLVFCCVAIHWNLIGPAHRI
jgi:CubicO group peptidase (beta-lactamase class C family)